MSDHDTPRLPGHLRALGPARRAGAWSATPCVDRRDGAAVLAHVLAPHAAVGIDVDALARAFERLREPAHARVLALRGVERAADGPCVLTAAPDAVTLATWLEREQRLPALEAVRVLRETAEVLAAAHARGLAHLDVCTDHVLWCEQHVVLRGIGWEGARRAAGGAALGTSASPHDARVDLCGLAQLGYAMLGGGGAHAPNAPVLPRLAPVLPPGLGRWITRQLSTTGDASFEPVLRLLRGLVTPGPAYEHDGALAQAEYFLRHEADELPRALERFERALARWPASDAAAAGAIECRARVLAHGCGEPRAAAAPARVQRPGALADGAFALWGAQDARAARAAYAEAGASAAAWIGAARAALFDADVAAALDAAERALAVAPDDPRALDAHAGALRSAGRPAEAAAAFERADALAPGWTRALAIGEALVDAARVDEGMARLEHAAELARRHPRALAALVRARAKAGRPEFARAALEELREKHRRASGTPAVAPALVASALAALGEPADEWRARARACADPALVLLALGGA